MAKLHAPSPGVESRRLSKAKAPYEHPDGGYGWVIVLAFSLNMVLINLMVNLFGLIFKDTFRKLQIKGADLATIMNVNVAFSLLLGIGNGAMIRGIGYRKMAAIGALFASLGMVLTSFAQSFIEFFIYYGLIMSTGLGLCTPAFTVALNSYFRFRRSLAIGVATTLMGLGSILFPQLVSVLLPEYGAQGTSLIFAGLALNGLVTASLLQPVSWHCKAPQQPQQPLPKKPPVLLQQPLLLHQQQPPPVQPQQPPVLSQQPLVLTLESPSGSSSESDEEGGGLVVLGLNDVDEDIPARTWQRLVAGDFEEDDEQQPLPVLQEETAAELQAEQAEQAEQGAAHWEAALAALRRRSSTISSTYFSARQTSDGAGSFAGSALWASSSVLDLGSSAFALNEAIPEEPLELLEPLEPPEPPTRPASPRSEGALSRWSRAVVEYFDLTLLQKATTVNLMMGVSLAFFSEMNFSQFTPFILAERGLSTPRVATHMSVIAVADTASRFAAPFLHSALGLSSKVMYMLALTLLCAVRTVLLLVHDPGAMMTIMVAIGVTKGFRTVFYNQVIPDNVPLDRLASAIGLQAVLNGIIFFAMGPLLGLIQDRTGRYDALIIACNTFTMLAVSMWLVEMGLAKLRQRRRKRAKQHDFGQ